MLFKIIENISKVQTITRYYAYIYKFLNFANSKGYSHLEDVDFTIVKEFIDNLKQEGKSYLTITSYKESIDSFYKSYSVNFKDLMTLELKETLKIDRKLLKIVQEENKTPDIPRDYYDNFLSSIIRIIDDNDAPYYIRATACVYLILSQTGLRISEVLGLELNMLKETTIFNGDKAYFLQYKTWKREKGNNTFSIVKTYINKLSKKGYDTLVEIYKDKRTKLNLPYVFLGGDRMKKASQFPVNSTSFDNFQERFFKYLDNNKYMETINLDENKYPQLSYKKVDGWLQNRSVNHPQINTITYPTSNQFRVHVCTELYKAGVPLQYIEKFMAHLSEEMKGYYVRTTPSNPQEDMEFAYKTLEKVVTGETKLLGGTGDLSEKIQEFIEQNHYNVDKDTKTIVQELVKKIPVRQKTGGVCIKSSIRECSTDYATDEFYCSYGACPNVFHFYYMANFSYSIAKECEESFLYHKENGFLRQAEKELNKLKKRVKDKLIPELDELKKVIERKGSNAVLEEYPALLEIILNIDSVYKETKKWLKLKI
ncbi:tyrosine-type recombinase/integrase [Clostridium sp. DJ247]|uniref:tyrosine-type recombinase/integrase n=1 Tax=Clostridium sp. DJ247 TaxID=2726188 RepID=UPI00162458F2|nr:tyrosine-type recombinase/integrase [Clostridium sp. DJ247]MBC2579042.1 tyrosine-type recombinase/integrase [Clostridium sp. DJ247]